MPLKHTLQIIRDLLQTPWSIRSVVVQDEREWFAKNIHRQRRAFTKLEWDLLHVGEHPWRFALSLLTLHCLLLTFVALAPQNWLPFSAPRWSNPEQLTNFYTIWTIQSTLAALVYPIVISFVAVYLQRRPAAEVFINLYMLNSGALAAGISSLTLVIAMGIQFLMMSTLGIALLPCLATIDTVWFVLNAAMTTFFLYRTVEFLRPEVQAKVIQRYTISVALPRDVQRFNSDKVLASAIDKGWLSVPSYLDDTATKGPTLLISRYFFTGGTIQGYLHVRTPSRLIDVRIWLLKLVVESWYRSALKMPQQLGDDNSLPLLKLPISSGTVYENDFPLARVQKGPALSIWQRYLLRWAVTMRPTARERYSMRVEAILNELAADVRNMAEKSDYEGFDRAYNTLFDLHELLLEACIVKTNSGNHGSWALLQDTDAFWGRALHENWSNIYRGVFQAAIASMDKDSRPLRRLCHLLTHFDSDELRASPLDIRENLLKLPPLMMYLLSNWWTFRAEEQGITEHSHEQMVLLRPPLNRVYEEVLIDFVGGWENGRPETPQKDGFLLDWATLPEFAGMSAKHIEETARMMLAAVFRGDQAAAEWLADVLSKWWDTLDFDLEPYQLYEKSSFITIDDLGLTWAEFSTKYGLEMGTVETQAGLQKGAYQAALENYWTDIRLLTVELMFDWIREASISSASSSLAFEIATGLLTGKHWKAGGQTVNSLRNISPSKYLVAKVRQFAATGRQRSSYLTRLDQFVARIKDMLRPNMVSSRVYSFGGPDNVASLRESQIELMTVLTNETWKSSRSLQRQMSIWVAGQLDSINLLKTRLDSWLDQLNAQSELSIEHIDLIKRHIRSELPAQSALVLVNTGLQTIQQELNSLLDATIAAQPIDPDRLQEIEQYASEYGFGKEKGRFPVNQFPIEYTPSTLQDFTLTFTQVRRGEITRMQIEQRPVNEDKYYADAMARQVANVILNDVLQRSEIREIATENSESYWMALRAEANPILARGETPILLVENTTSPEWFWSWQHEDLSFQHKRPSDLQVRRIEGQGVGYQCNLNEIEVYLATLPIGQSLILSKDEFRALTFTDYGGGRYVRAEVIEPDGANNNLVDLKLTFSRKVEVSRPKITRLVYPQIS